MNVLLISTKEETKDLESGEFGLDLAPPGKGSVLWHVLHVGAVRSEASVGPHAFVDIAIPLAEAPLLTHVDLQKSGDVICVNSSNEINKKNCP